MAFVAPFPNPSPAPFLNLRTLADPDPLFSNCSLSASTRSLSPASSLTRTAFADLLQSRANLQSPCRSPRSKALSSPRSLSSLGPDARRSSKENRDHACGSPKSGSTNRASLQRKRPAKLAIPESARLASLVKAEQFALPEQTSDTYHHEVELFAVVSKRGRKDRMEDSYTASTHVQGNSKQAFFGVFDGHGGKHAAEFAAANLGRHVSTALQEHKDGNNCIEDAMSTAYRNADAEFLNQRLSSGACAVSVLVKDGEMVVANAGDCKAVLSRAGKAESLSTVHRASNEGERQRVEDLGGFVDSYNGTWRLQGTLAVTRGFGDANLKRWVSAEPATKRVDITRDCEFLILASDGLWDQMSDQEAVDCARKNLSSKNKDGSCLTPVSSNHQERHFATSSFQAQKKEDTLHVSHLKKNACNELINIACHRGNRDDITVMIVPLKTFTSATYRGLN